MKLLDEILHDNGDVIERTDIRNIWPLTFYRSVGRNNGR